MTHTSALSPTNAGLSARRMTRPAVSQDANIPWALALAARGALAARLGVPPDAVTVSDAQMTTFTSTALGFPERDGMYASYLREGTIVRFTCGGRRYAFHGVGSDVSDGLFGELPPSGQPTWWTRDERGLFVPDPDPTDDAARAPAGRFDAMTFCGYTSREMKAPAAAPVAVHKEAEEMSETARRSTIYLDPALHRALRLKAAETSSSVSELVNSAVRLLLAEDAQDLATVRARATEPLVSYEEMLQKLAANGLL